MSQPVQAALWGGRFSEGINDVLRRLSFSLHVDRRLLPQDIRGSIAHARALGRAGLLTTSEVEAIEGGLSGILQDVEAGSWPFSEDDEDVHMAVERVLTERIGEAGRKLHTGRSRNDQVATAFTLWMLDQVEVLQNGVRTLQEVVVRRSAEHAATLMPGYTHLQHAQPVTLGHYLLSMFWALQRDLGRLEQVRRTLSACPLGSGALAGSAFAIDRQTTAAELGFDRPSENSMDAVGHRDGALEFLSACAILATSLSRYAEDFVNWSTSEFGFVTFSDAFTTGSSMMPQKKNPDGFELARGKTGRVVGNLAGLFTTVKGVPLTYCRDLQEDKEPVFDGAGNALELLRLFAGALEDAVFHPEAMRARLTGALLATDVADLLVEGGMPFRDAHQVVGTLVGQAARSGTDLLDLPLSAWALVPGGEKIRACLSWEGSLARRNLTGGTGPQAVENQIASARAILSREAFT